MRASCSTTSSSSSRRCSHRAESPPRWSLPSVPRSQHPPGRFGGVAHRSRSLELLVFAVGAGSLGAEIAAARLLAPWFGASTIVWANTIATVLVALAAGYWIGGRPAHRDPPIARPPPGGLAGPPLLAALPLVAPPLPPVRVP